MNRFSLFLSPACTFFACREFAFAIVTVAIQFLCVCWICACLLILLVSRFIPSFGSLLLYCGTMIPLFGGGWVVMGYWAMGSERKLQRAKRITAAHTLRGSGSKELGQNLQGRVVPSSPESSGERAEGCTVGITNGQPAA